LACSPATQPSLRRKLRPMMPHPLLLLLLLLLQEM
jgi:hypothetical protein